MFVEEKYVDISIDEKTDSSHHSLPTETEILAAQQDQHVFFLG